MRNWLNRRIEGLLDNAIFGAIVAGGTIVWSILNKLPAPLIFVIGLAVFALILFILKITRDILSKKPKDAEQKSTETKTEPPPSALPSHIYIADTYIQGRVIYLMDLLAPGAKPIISNRTIEDCEIRGPAMVALLGLVTITESSFDGDVDSLFVEVADKRIILGAIGLQNCVFRRCRFAQIGILGTREQIEKAKQGFTPSASHKEGSQS